MLWPLAKKMVVEFVYKQISNTRSPVVTLVTLYVNDNGQISITGCNAMCPGYNTQGMYSIWGENTKYNYVDL